MLTSPSHTASILVSLQSRWHSTSMQWLRAALRGSDLGPGLGTIPQQLLALAQGGQVSSAGLPPRCVRD